MMKNKAFIFSVIVLLTSLLPVQAQDTELPIYIVQSGDTMYSIALQFGLSIDDLVAANTQLNPDWLAEGDQVRIPGFDGVQGVFVPYTIQLNDTYQSLLRKQILDETTFKKINRITSPNEIIAGLTIILPVSEQNGENSPIGSEIKYHAPILNDFSENSTVWAGDVNHLVKTFIENQSVQIANLDITPYPFQQGKTSFIRFNADPGKNFQLQVDSATIPVFEVESGQYLAFYGINALGTTGLDEVNLISDNGDISEPVFSQNLLANLTAYPTDPIIIVEPDLINPEKTKPEENELFQLASLITEKDLWDGTFSYPVDDACVRSPYGSTRSYNNGPYDTFHTGIDFGNCAQNLNIYAAGSGRVVYAGPWFVRGNSVVIDHGWGIYTGYWHQESILVKVGDIVQEGQQIGTAGTTGRSTGIHLHWEVLVNAVQVDPAQWMDLSVP